MSLDCVVSSQTESLTSAAEPTELMSASQSELSEFHWIYNYSLVLTETFTRGFYLILTGLPNERDLLLTCFVMDIDGCFNAGFAGTTCSTPTAEGINLSTIDNSKVRSAKMHCRSG